MKANNFPGLIEKYISEDLIEPISKNEEIFFYRLKSVLHLNSVESTDYYAELTTCLNLYKECAITKTQLIELVRPLFELTDPSSFFTTAKESYKNSVSKEDT